MRLLAIGDCLADIEFLQRADDLRADRVAGVQRVERVLEHHLDGGHRVDATLLDAGGLDLAVAERNLT
jgi:hypothetical protein